MVNYSYTILLLLLSLNIPFGYSATVYKCEGGGEGGSTLFSETPCKSQKGQKLYYQENYQPGEGLSILEIQALQEIEQREKQQNQETNLNEQQTNQTQKTLVEVHDKQECETADKAVNEWQKIMSLGYPDESDKYYQDELRERYALRYEMCGY